MKRRQLDLYAECNVEPRAPLDLFTAECCSRCVNPECTRSNFSNSKFESRVSNWYERLFADVPRMAPDDERFGRIAGQKFFLIDPGTTTSSQGWVDPLAPRRVQVPVPIEVSKGQAPELKITYEPDDGPASAIALEKRAPASAELALLNTPVTQGQMIGGARPPTPASSEWRTPVSSNDKVVKTGAKIKIGS